MSCKTFLLKCQYKPFGQERQAVGVGLVLYWPGMHGVQLPSFDVDPSMVDDLCAEGLWKPTPAGHVVLVMF